MRYLPSLEPITAAPDDPADRRGGQRDHRRLARRGCRPPVAPPLEGGDCISFRPDMASGSRDSSFARERTAVRTSRSRSVRSCTPTRTGNRNRPPTRPRAVASSYAYSKSSSDSAFSESLTTRIEDTAKGRAGVRVRRRIRSSSRWTMTIGSGSESARPVPPRDDGRNEESGPRQTRPNDSRCFTSLSRSMGFTRYASHRPR